MPPYFQKILGLVALVIGIFLIVRGHDMSKSIGSQANQLVYGTPSNQVTYYYIGGIVLAVFGLSQLVWPGRSK